MPRPALLSSASEGYIGLGWLRYVLCAILVLNIDHLSSLSLGQFPVYRGGVGSLLDPRVSSTVLDAHLNHARSEVIVGT